MVAPSSENVKRSILFVGHLNPSSDQLAAASSVAGNEVQRTIIRQLRLQYGEAYVLVISMYPRPAWPRGPLMVRAQLENSIRFPGYINLPVLKHIIFAFRIFLTIIVRDLDAVIQYNCYLLENLSLLFSRYIRGTPIVIYLQDVNTRHGASIFSKSFSAALTQNLSMSLARRVDLVVAISEAIIVDFRLPRERCIVFQGAPTAIGNALLDISSDNLERIAVFAGSITRDNGIDRLVNRWIDFGIPWPLHVFGRGSLDEFVKLKARDSVARVVYHGLVPPERVVEWQSRAMWNFCLRYSEQIDERYFFPSKFFDAGSAPGALVVNDFHAIPEQLRDTLIIVDSELESLPTALELGRRAALNGLNEARREIIRREFSWQMSVEEVLDRLRQLR